MKDGPRAHALRPSSRSSMLVTMRRRSDHVMRHHAVDESQFPVRPKKIKLTNAATTARRAWPRPS